MPNKPRKRKKSELVTWCNDCHWWLPEDEIGNRCPSSDCERTLVKRRVYICHEIGCECAYKEKKAFEQHEHGDCY